MTDVLERYYFYVINVGKWCYFDIILSGPHAFISKYQSRFVISFMRASKIYIYLSKIDACMNENLIAEVYLLKKVCVLRKEKR